MVMLLSFFGLFLILAGQFWLGLIMLGIAIFLYGSDE